MEIQQISKGEDSGVDTGEVLRVFKQSAELSEIKEIVEKAKERLFVSWATVDAVDKDDERIPIEEAVTQHEIGLRRGGTLNDMHTNRQVGRMLAYKVMTHPKTKTPGVLQLNKVYNDNDLDDSVWAEIKSGERTGLSLGGFHKKDEYKMEEGKLVKILSGYQQYETSSVYKPANQYALNEAVSSVAKSEKSDVDGSFFTLNGIVYKIEKQGKCLNEPFVAKSYEDTEKEDNKINVPESVRNNAKRALELKEKNPDAGTSAGWSTANLLANNSAISRDKAEEIVAWHARHKGNESVDPKNKDSPEKDNGYVMHLAWGGDSARGLVEKNKSNSNVLKKNNEKECMGANTMAKQEEGKDILDVAMQKMEDGESLSDEEKSAIKAMLKTKKQDSKQDSEEEEPKEEDNEDKKADGEALGKPGAKDQPEDVRPEEANQVDVAKFSAEIMKSLKEEIKKTVKAELSSVKKSQSDEDKKISTTPTPEAGTEVTKSKAEDKPAFMPNEIAKGAQKLSWSELNYQMKKMGGEE